MGSVAFLTRGRIECVKHSHLNPNMFTVGQVCPTCRVEWHPPRCRCVNCCPYHPRGAGGGRGVAPPSLSLLGLVWEPHSGVAALLRLRVFLHIVQVSKLRPRWWLRPDWTPG